MKPIKFPENEDIDFSKKLNVKFGIDPTSDKLHLGHLIPLLLAKKLFYEGHNVEIVLGTFTAQLGDPSGKDTMRPILSKEETEKNAKNIKKQVERIFGHVNGFSWDTSILNFHLNHEWFEEMSASELVNILSKFTTTQLLSRDSFQKRMEEKNPIGIHELIVPILQGYDSVKLKTDVEIGGTDQLFNFAITRDMQKAHNQKPEVCLLMPVINGTDGRKMSKSFGNCIFLNDTPEDVFGKVMSISDELMREWWPIILGNQVLFGLEEHPMEMKKELAWHITDNIWESEKADKAQAHFENVIQNNKLPKNMAEIKAGNSIMEVVMEIRSCSKSEARRLINSKSVRVKCESDESATVVLDGTIIGAPGLIINVGKKDFAKLI